VIASHSVCQECKARNTTCLLVGRGVPCLGPVTRAGCGALCPSIDRGCFGCFGPTDGANSAALARRLQGLGASDVSVARLFGTFNTAAPGFVEQAQGRRIRVASPAIRSHANEESR
jgi:hypothetical protein